MSDKAAGLEDIATRPPLPVVLCWHMHQPDYRTGPGREFQLPWTYLHATKDYVDMAGHLEAIHEARAVVNFAPILLDQIADYARQIDEYLCCAGPIRDPLLSALANPVPPETPEERDALIEACLRTNEQRLINRFSDYRRLADIAFWLREHKDARIYLSNQYVTDLLVWYHLAWTGETVRREDSRVRALIGKGRAFTLHDRRVLLEVIGDLLSGVIGRYRRLAESGRVELSVTPFAHPIVPLLLDLRSAEEQMPDVRLPLVDHYPGGAERVRWHIEEGLRAFERHFGIRPRGCWPAEGAVSDATARVLESAGFEWMASGGRVLANSLHRAEMESNGCIHQAYRTASGQLMCYFRDDGLSDLIGFEYASWHADDAVSNLVHHLENIAAACTGNENAVVAIIMDGENAWEAYPENGYHFLQALYHRLVDHPRIALTTFTECGARLRNVRVLPSLAAGSWVYGTFSTWIGDQDKNRGWEMLCDAKRAFDHAVQHGRLIDDTLRRAERQLAVCEGSDWFWWFGDYNPGDTVLQFERLYRNQLAHLYGCIGEEPPEYLSQSFTHGGGYQPLGGVMRQTS